MAGQSEADTLAKIEPLVLQELASQGQTDYFIWLTEKADLSPAADLPTKEAKGQFVFDALTSTAERTQRDLRAYLDAQGANYRPFYISNKIMVRAGSEALLMDLAGRADVAQITANHQFQLPEPFINPNPPKQPLVGIEPNLTFVNADDVWALGYDGAGLVLAGNDTGLDWDHPALINQYRGWNGSIADHNYNWWDATGTYPNVPDDGHGHGTHTTGTMVGDDGGSNRIGVAPGAQTIHCKNMTNGGNGDDFTFSECFEFDLAPWDLTMSNPMPSLAPHAVNNSWGYPGGDQPQLQDEVDALQAAGIVVEASAGNEGSSCSSLRSPGDYAQALTTGSVNHTSSMPGTLTGFSSRGPSGIHPGDFFPDIMAPGENINSSLPGGGYSGPTWSGTSMSGPHVTALIALMWEASPALIGDIDTTYQAIYDTAVPLVGQNGSNCGGNYTVGPNNDWGYGTMDALAAVNEAIQQGGPGYTLAAEPATQEICTPSNALYDVTVGQILGFNSPVTMSAQGHPAGTTATFVPNPVTPPNDTTLTIGNTGAAAAGSYNINILGTTATKTVTITVGLDVYTASPGSVTLTAPANGAVAVSVKPTYVWSAATQGDSYDIEVATDAGFSNIVYSVTVDGTSHQQTTPLDLLTTYYWHVRANNTCGTGSFSGTFSFTTTDVLPVLLVDDDNNSPDVLSYYTDSLDNLGVDYDIWDTGSANNEPDETELAAYNTVIWFSGVQFGGSGNPIAGPGPAAATALGNWLDDGNCMFISAQDYYYDFGLTTFMDTYLGVASATSDVAQATVTGAGSIFAGLGPYTLAFPFSNYSDIINPDGDAEVAFTGNAGNAAVNKDSGVYRTTFWGFPFEAIPTQTDRDDAMGVVVDFCGAGGPIGRLEGQVTDADSSQGIEGALITADDGVDTRTTYTDENGEYGMNLAIGTYDVTASADNYVSETVNNIVIITDTTEIQDFVLQGSSLTYSPPSIEEDMEIGDVVTNTVTVTNTGPLPIDYSVSIGNYGGPNGQPAGQSASFDAVTPVVGPAQQAAANTSGLNLPPVAGAPLLAAGDVLDSWAITGIPAGWGIAYDGTDLWISSPVASWGGNGTMNKYGVDGTPGGTSYPYNWNPANGPADATYNWNTGMLWVMDVATDDCIHEIDPGSGITGNTICPGFPISQRGLAYDPSTDTYLAGSWNDLTVYRFDTSGTILEQVNVGLSISGLAYNPDTMHLFVMVNASPNPVYVLDAANNYSVVGQFNVSEGFTDFSGAGLEFDCSGNLWAIDQVTYTTYLFESGETGSFCGGGWAYAVPDSGTIPANSSATFDVVFDASSLYEVGSYTAELSFSGTFVNDVPDMPLIMNLSCPDCGFMDGSITDEYTGDPLSAEIHITGPNAFDVTLNDDSYDLAVQPGTYHVEVTADGYFPEEADVVVTQGGTVTTDFALTPMIAFLEYSPNTIEETMGIGEIVSNTVTVTNTGFVDLEFEVNIGGWVWPLRLQPIYTTPLNPDGSEGSGGPVASLSQFAASNPQYPAVPFEQPEAMGSFILDQQPNGVNGYFTDAGCDICGTGAQAIADNFTLTAGTSVGAINIWSGYFPTDVPTPDDITIIFHQDGGGVPGAAISTQTAVPSERVQTGVILFGVHEYFHTFTLDEVVALGPGTYWVQILNDTGFGTDDFFWETGNVDNDPNTPAAGIEGSVWSTTVPGSTWNPQPDSLSIQLIEGVAGPEWAYAVPTSATVPPMSVTTFEVVFDSTVLTVTGTYEAELTFSGNFENEVDPIALILHLTDEEQVIDVALSDDQAQSATMGSEVEYVFTVTNMGNTTDSFELSVNSSWPAELSATNTGSLAPGDSFDVTVTVHVPYGLADGSTSTATLTATSDTDSGVSDTAQATTTAMLITVGLPAIIYND